MSDPTYWRVEGTCDLLSPDTDLEDRFGFAPQWEVVADEVTEKHHAEELAVRYLKTGVFYAVRLVDVYVETRTEARRAMRMAPDWE